MALDFLDQTVNDDQMSATLEFPEVSIVIPCLNEADTIEKCIAKAQQALWEGGIKGEVIVADNGSTDGSQTIATRLGARVVKVETRGYGAALMGGIAAARGKFIVMGDGDDSYSFLELPRFIEKLREGVDLVQGCRLPSGKGRIMPGAMPFLHRWLGNPMLTAMARCMFSVPIHDIYCGMRGFTKRLYARLDQRCTGMEFAVEMIIKASLAGAKISEIPITLYVDGRVSHAPHLRTFRDGWRTLRFFLIYSPRWLYMLPGILLVLLGFIGYGLAMPGLVIFGLKLDAHTLLFANLAILLGYQSILFGIFTQGFAMSEGLMMKDRFISSLLKFANLEKGLLSGSIAMLGGLVLLSSAVNQWRLTGFGNLDYAHTMRLVIPGVTLMALGFQTVLASFFMSILGMRRK
jgi:glycosyltransferase involved in cell wall biosynthesis